MFGLEHPPMRVSCTLITDVVYSLIQTRPQQPNHGGTVTTSDVEAFHVSD
jgi:hypothetical protein